MSNDPRVRDLAAAVAFVLGVFALLALFAMPAGATEANPCGNHGNNCICETVDGGESVSPSVVCAAVADAYVKAFAEATSASTASCVAAAAACEQAVSSSSEASAACGDVSLTCNAGGEYGGRLCADRRFKYNENGQVRRTFCRRYVIPVVEQ